MTERPKIIDYKRVSKEPSVWTGTLDNGRIFYARIFLGVFSFSCTKHAEDNKIKPNTPMELIFDKGFNSDISYLSTKDFKAFMQKYKFLPVTEPTKKRNQIYAELLAQQLKEIEKLLIRYCRLIGSTVDEVASNSHKRYIKNIRQVFAYIAVEFYNYKKVAVGALLMKDTSAIRRYTLSMTTSQIKQAELIYNKLQKL